MSYYKVLGAGRTARHDGTVWPQAKRWTAEVADPVLCERGWHLVPASHLIDFLDYGPEVWTAEPHPDAIVVEGDDKVVCSKARLLERTLWDETRARLFAADCAARVLPIFEREHPDDGRPGSAIEVARLYALGLATDGERAAAGAAAGDAAWDAAGAAAGAAVWAAAGVAARACQPERLLAYLTEPDLTVLLVEDPR